MAAKRSAVSMASVQEPEYAEVGLESAVEQAISVVIPEAAEQQIDFELTRRPVVLARVVADSGGIQQLLVQLLLETVRSSPAGVVRVSIRLEDAGDAVPPAALLAVPEMEHAEVMLVAIAIESASSVPAKVRDLCSRLCRSSIVHSAIVKASEAGLRFYCGVPAGTVAAFRRVTRGDEDTTRLHATDETGAWLVSGHMDREHLAEKRAAAHERPLTILLADDYEVNRMVLQSQLERLGYRPDMVTNGEEVLRALHARSYDLVFLDIRMPVLDGLETSTEIRRNRSLNQPFIAAVTGDSTLDRKRIRDAGMDVAVVKPVDMEALVSILNRAYERKAPGATAAPTDHSVGTVALDLEPLYSRLGRAADDLLRKVIPVYLRELPGRRSSLSEAFRTGDAPAFARLCHGLKGSSRSIGAAMLAQSCERLEQDAYEGQLPTAETLAELLDLATRTGTELRQRLEALDS